MHRPCQGQDLRRLTHLGANAGHRCRQHHHIGAQSGFYLGAHQNVAQSATLTEKLNAARKVATQAAFAPIYSANLQHRFKARKSAIPALPLGWLRKRISAPPPARVAR